MVLFKKRGGLYMNEEMNTVVEKTPSDKIKNDILTFPLSPTRMYNIKRWSHVHAQIYIDEAYKKVDFKNELPFYIEALNKHNQDITEFFRNLTQIRDYFILRKNQIAKIREQKFSKKSSKEEKQESIKLFDFKSELDIIKNFIECATNFSYIAYVLYNQTDGIKNYDSIDEYVDELALVAGTPESYPEKMTKESLVMSVKSFVKRFYKASPETFYRIKSEKGLSRPRKTTSVISEYNTIPATLTNLIIYAKQLNEDIYKFTFAMRAEMCLEYKNNRIREHNKKNGTRYPIITQTSIRLKYGKNKSTVSDYFIGKTLPSADFLIMFADMVDVPIDYLTNPNIEIGYLRDVLSDGDESYKPPGEVSFIYNFLMDRWSKLNSVTNDQASLIEATLNYLIKDIFVDYEDDGVVPTLSKPFDYAIRQPHINIGNMLERARKGTLKFNRDSVLYLIGRYLFDHYKPMYLPPEGINDKAIGLFRLNKMYDLRNLAASSDEDLQKYKKIIGEIFGDADRLEPLLSSDDFQDDISQYFLEQLLTKLRGTLTKHSEINEKMNIGEIVDEEIYLPAFDPQNYRGDYDEFKYRRKQINSSMREQSRPNNGFSVQYAPTREQKPERTYYEVPECNFSIEYLLPDGAPDEVELKIIQELKEFGLYIEGEKPYIVKEYAIKQIKEAYLKEGGSLYGQETVKRLQVVFPGFGNKKDE